MKKINNRKKIVIDVDKLLVSKNDLDEDHVKYLLDKVLNKSSLAIEIVDEEPNNI